MAEQPATAQQQRPRGKRARAEGVVTSDGRDKTIKVETRFSRRHSKYGKYVRGRTVYHVHDENNEARKGDRVEIVQCRPVSRTKSWRLVRIVHAAPREEVRA